METHNSDKIGNIIVVGNGKTAIDCIEILMQYIEQNTNPYLSLCGVLIDKTRTYFGRSLTGFCKKNDIPCWPAENINGENIIQLMQRENIDLVFSINNFQMMGLEFIKSSKKGTINIHNSPLPRYAGMNAVNWAIINGETTHGVTLHYIDPGVDSGDIIATKIFPVDKTYTAMDLTLLTARKAVSLFKEILPKILEGRAVRYEQVESDRTVYYKNDVPNNGIVDFRWGYKRINNFVRGLNFRPFPNNFCHPRAQYKSARFYIDKIDLIEYRMKHQIGEIISANSQLLSVQVKDAVISLVELRNQDKKLITIRKFINQYSVIEYTRMDVVPMDK